MSDVFPMLTSAATANPDNAMEEAYPYRDLWINGRSVTFEKLLQGQETGRTAFEESTFTFIKEWLTGTSRFSMQTSGSTGHPKSITVTREQMVASARRTAQKINLRKSMMALVCIDTKYIAGKMMLVRSLITGLRILAVEPSANPLIRVPVDKFVQFTAMVPYQINAVLESKHPHLLNNLEKVLIGGAPLNDQDREALNRFQCECFETYGMTETVSHIALRLVNTENKQQYFETLPGVEISLDERGCLVISTDFLPEPVTTNDVVAIAAPGKFSWIGRWDSVINTGGVKVIPEKIEKELQHIFKEQAQQHPFFIAALPDDRLGNKIVLVLEGVQFSSELLLQAMEKLKAAVSPYEFPKEVYTIPQFVFTKTQKIDRKRTLNGITFLCSLK